MKPIFTFIFSFWNLVSMAQTKISVDSVNSYRGELVTVCGKVFGIKYLEKSQLTFIDLGAPYPEARLTIVIFGKDRAKFPQSPETLYTGKKVCITGKIAEYNGRLQIVVNSPKEIVAE